MKKDQYTRHYVAWQQTRLAKIKSLLREETFNNAKVLELGCGHGFIGRELMKLGSNVTFSDYRTEHLDYLKDNFYSEARCVKIDQEETWELHEKFDIIIHMGVLYHLTNWKNDLLCAINHMKKYMVLETIVSDNKANDYECVCTETSGYDQSPYLTSKRPSAKFIEKTLKNYGVKFTRYDDADLNTDKHKYDWEEKNTQTGKIWIPKPIGTRRFWIIEK